MGASTKVRSRYELRDILSKGGMGVVYRAWDTLMKREVALKTIIDVHSRSAFDLFYKEWGLQASIIHPNIIEIYDIGEFEDGGVTRPYFVMPLLPGCSLADLIRDSSHRLTVERSVDIITQTCRGLQAAHERGLIHRDIKPSNIFVMTDDSVKIIDFGIAFTEAGATHTAMRGTLPYMAPELLQLKPPTVLTDIFALGAVSYEVLTRRHAFDGQTDTELTNAILHGNPPPASSLNPTVSQLLSQVVHKAIAKQPWHRYSSAREYGETLQKALRNEPIAFFDKAHVQPRIERATRAFERGEYQFATEILDEMEGEGHVDPEISILRRQVEQAVRQITIRQVLESARRFYEEDEYSLALRKIQEALQLDPNHAEALALKNEVEKNRRAKQLEEWSQLARQHLENHAFGQARNAIQSLLDLKPDDADARELLAEVNRREQEYDARRGEKTRLYDDAVQCWQSGEVTSALTRLERWLALDREMPDTDSARVLSCQNFYKQVRGEHEALRNSYEQARRHLSDQNFNAALEICDQYLAKYPAHALFQALKFDVEERRRKNLSAFIAETDRRAENEPDLDKRCGIIEEALKQFPGEAHFERALRLAKDKRNLVNSVVQKARTQEEQGRFAEGLETWEVLRAIYAQYPGLEFEIARVSKRRDTASRGEARSGWVQLIDKLLENREFEKAADAAEKALGEFPDEAELVELEKLACKRIATSLEAKRRVEAGREESLAGRHDPGLDLMRGALELDRGDPVVRATLVDALVDRARALSENGQGNAEALIDELLELDPQNPYGRSLRRGREDTRREEFVSWCAAQARRLQAAGDIEGARAVLGEGLASVPGEPGLSQLAASLDQQAGDGRRRELERVQPLRVEQEVQHDGQTAIALGGGERPPGGPPAGVATFAESAQSAIRFADTAGALLIHPPQKPSFAPPPSPPPPVWAPPRNSGGPPPTSPQGGRRQPPAWLVATLAAAGILFLAGLARVVSNWKPAATAGAVAPVAVSILTTPPGAHVTIDGKDNGVSGASTDLPVGVHTVQVAMDGFEPATKQISLAPNSPLTLQIPLVPISPSVRVSTDTPSPVVKLDDAPVEGVPPDFTSDHVAPGHHVLTVDSNQGQATVPFDMAPGQAPAMSGPVTAKDVNAVVVNQLGDKAWLYTSEPLRITIDNGLPIAATPSGLQLPPLAQGNHELTLDDGKSQRKLGFITGASPALIAFVQQKAAPETGGIAIIAGEDNVNVSINGKPYRRQTKKGQLHIASLKPGDYTIAVAKDGFATVPAQKVTVKTGEEARAEFHLTALPRFATLRVQGAPAGAEILIDGNATGAVQTDGSFTGPVSPGTHTVQLRNGRAISHPLQRLFAAGQTAQLSPAEVALQVPQGAVRFHITPAGAHITLRPENERDGAPRTMTSQDPITLPEGSWIVTATAPDHNPATRTITVSPDAPVTVELALVPHPKKPATSEITGFSHWEDPGGWTPDGQWMIHKGGNFVAFQPDDIKGRVEFNVLLNKGKRLQWFVGRSDPRNYVLFKLEKKDFIAERVTDGRSREISKTQHSLDKDQPIAVRIEVNGGTITTMARQGGGWVTLGTVSAADADFSHGRFGFYVPGKDEFAVSSFGYYPK